MSNMKELIHDLADGLNAKFGFKLQVEDWMSGNAGSLRDWIMNEVEDTPGMTDKNMIELESIVVKVEKFI